MEVNGQLIEQFFSSVSSATIVWFSGLSAAIFFIRKVSKDADDDLAPERRQALAENLARITTPDPGPWIPNFTYVFDRFFGKKHFRWRCFYRSALISIFTFAVLLLLTDIPAIYAGLEILIIAISLSTMLNAIIDYLSLLETRLLLNTRMPVSAKILIDAILTFLMTFSWCTIVLSPIADISILETAQFVWRDLRGDISRNNPEFIRIVFVTSYSTSIWLWLHGLAPLTIRLLSVNTSIFSWLNVKEKPIRAIGTTINIYILLIGVLLFPIFLIIKY